MIPVFAMATWEHRKIESGGYQREFRVYKPVDFDPSEQYSLVIGVHGLGDNMWGFSEYLSDFQMIADTARIIMAYPQGTPNLIGNGWNAAAGNLGIYPSEQYDDVGFINQIVDIIQSEFNIIKKQTYLFGFSNGGYMVQRIACQANDKFYAIASIAGTIGTKVYNCAPERRIPILHFHGTADMNVGYHADLFGMTVKSMLRLWSKHNECGEKDSVHITNVKPDGFKVVHYKYSNCIEPLEHIKVINAAHIILRKSENNYSYAEQMWKFFRQYKDDDSGVPTDVRLREDPILKIYPIPVGDWLNIDLSAFVDYKNLYLSIWDGSGKKIRQIENAQGRVSLDCSYLPNGLYFIKVEGESIMSKASFTVVN